MPMKNKSNKEKTVAHTNESQIFYDLFSILGRDLSDLKVAEFGAWDGFLKSNVRPFFSMGCSVTVFIEASAKKFYALKGNYEGRLGVHLMNEFESIKGYKSFCSIISLFKRLAFYSWVAVNPPERITFSNIEKYMTKLFK